MNMPVRIRGYSGRFLSTFFGRSRAMPLRLRAFQAGSPACVHAIPRVIFLVTDSISRRDGSRSPGFPEQARISQLARLIDDMLGGFLRVFQERLFGIVAQRQVSEPIGDYNIIGVYPAHVALDIGHGHAFVDGRRPAHVRAGPPIREAVRAFPDDPVRIVGRSRV